MKLTPLRDWIVVQRIAEKETTIGGLYVPEQAREKPAEGIVVAVGPGAHQNGVLVAPGVKPGQRVMFSKYGGTEVNVGGEEVVLMHETDLFGVLA